MSTNNFDYQGLKEIVEYDPENGTLTYVKAPSPRHSYRIGASAINSYYCKGVRYPLVNRSSKRMSALKFIWWLVTGEHPVTDILVKNGDHFDLRWENLEQKSVGLLARNKFKYDGDGNIKSSTGHVGVSYDTSRDKYHAYIDANRRRIPLGRFTDLESAVSARKTAEAKYF